MYGAVTSLELFTAIKAKVAAQAGVLATMPVHFGRRPPNAVRPVTGNDTPYMIVAIEEHDDAEVESDGAVAQIFDVEMAIRTVGPDDAAAANAALVALDPAWYSNAHGVTLTDDEKRVVGVLPKTGKLRLIEPLKDGGQDQYSATRRWEVHCGASLGA